jgi:hypothetical protein
VGPGSAILAVLVEAARTAKDLLAGQESLVPRHYWPPIAAGLAIEGLTPPFAGQGGTVRLRRSGAGVPTAVIGLGSVVVLSTQTASGPESVVLQTDWFSQVAAVQGRRFTSACRGVEWCYQDRMAPDRSRDLSMARMVLTLPEGLPEGLDEVWQERVVAALLGQDI